jgi:hypothetical protein
VPRSQCVSTGVCGRGTCAAGALTHTLCIAVSHSLSLPPPPRSDPLPCPSPSPTPVSPVLPLAGILLNARNSGLVPVVTIGAIDTNRCGALVGASSTAACVSSYTLLAPPPFHRATTDSDRAVRVSVPPDLADPNDPTRLAPGLNWTSPAVLDRYAELMMVREASPPPASHTRARPLPRCDFLCVLPLGRCLHCLSNTPPDTRTHANSPPLLLPNPAGGAP